MRRVGRPRPPTPAIRAFQDKFAAQRRRRKEVLAKVIAERVGIAVDPAALFDVHVKRIHEYKRQLLNMLHCVALYDAMRAQPTRDWVKRVKIFAGKAAPGYAVAKQIIRLAHDVAHVVNNDPSVGGRLQDRVPAELQCQPGRADHPGRRPLRADLDGRHGGVRHRQHEARAQRRADDRHAGRRQRRDPRRVGPDNIFIFGLTAEQVDARKQRGLSAHDHVAASPALAQAIESIRRGAFSPGEPDRYAGLIHNLLERDTFMVACRLRQLRRGPGRVDRMWRDPAQWWRAAIINTAERRLVLLGPHDRPICRRDLGHPGRPPNKRAT